MTTLKTVWQTNQPNKMMDNIIAALENEGIAVSSLTVANPDARKTITYVMVPSESSWAACKIINETIL